MKKKLLTLGLSSTLALSSILPAFADTLASPNNNDARIEAIIGFKQPENIEDLKEKDLTATLSFGGQQIKISLNSFLNSQSPDTFASKYTVTPKVNLEGDKVSSVELKIEGLEPNEYTLTVDGDKYVTTTVNLNARNYSKKVSVNMILGDLNGDKKVTVEDRTLLEENINQNKPEYDLNNDGIIDIADIAIINANMGDYSSDNDNDNVLQMDTSVIPSSINVTPVTAENIQGVSEIQGDISDVFTEGKSITIIPNEETEKFDIPLEFSEPVYTETVEVSIPKGAESFKVAVDTGEETIKQNSLISTYSRTGENTENKVVINLGSRKPVKKITVTVTPSGDGTPVVVDDVKLIGDVENSNIFEDTKIKNVKAVAGNESVNLSWAPANNVTGYKIYKGTDPKNLEEHQTIDSGTQINITGLDNYTTYYFAISGVSGEWEGTKSSIVSAIPKAENKPAKPASITVTPGDSSIKVDWKETENAETYNIYTQTSEDSEPKKVASNLKGTSYTLHQLKNDVEYKIYLSAENNIGEGPLSDAKVATPKEVKFDIPTLPENNRIPNENVINVEMGHPHNVDSNLYPTFDPKWLVDGDFRTSWVARKFWEENSFTFTFKEPITMDYLVWVPRLDGIYKNYNQNYTIKVWKEGEDLSGPGTVVANEVNITRRFEDNKYYALTFPKVENVKKIYVKLGETPNGDGIRVNASEVAFYEYDSEIPNEIDKLFANGSRTKLVDGVQLETITALEARIESYEGIIADKEVLKRELAIAKDLLNSTTENFGLIKNNVYSVDPSKDVKAVNSWQPLGVVARPNEQVTIFANIPDDEEVYIVPTQFFGEAAKLSGAPIKLQNGRNTITIPQISDDDKPKGGSLYVTYKGNKASDIELQVIGGYKIPYLELNDFETIGEEKAKERINTFITELEAHKPKVTVDNHVEISLPSVLLSLPADKVLEGINDVGGNKVDTVYNTALAWEELLQVVYKTYGIDDPNGLETRHNIRYMQMFADGVFMYAAGNHVGIQYGSVAPLMQGKPTSVTGAGNPNKLFGWGIAHELGHVMDNLGIAEVTNNIYSLMAQTYDGNTNIGKSRLEGDSFEGSAYEGAFKKVSVGGKGVPNDVFVNLAMYWQLHLAYDNGENPFNFYNQLQKENRGKDLTDINNFAIAASQVAGKDLTEFFTRWGVDLSETAKSTMGTLEDETRAIYYLTDESRRHKLAGTGENQNVDVTATASIDETNPKQVNINITPNGTQKNVQGYEIRRNDKGIGFAKANEDGNASYTDYIGVANNMTFEYEVIPVDMLGNINETKNAGSVKISYDNVVESNKYTIGEDGIVTFTEPTIVTGIKITPKAPETALPTGQYKVYADIIDELNGPTQEEYIIAKDGDFSKDNFATSENTYLTYFNKSGATADKIIPYEVNKLKLENIDTTKYNVEFLSYPGDNIEFMDMGIGRLANDYEYISSYDDKGNPVKDVIKKDTLVIIGNYRGNSVTTNAYIKGKYVTSNPTDENNYTIDSRLVEGYTLMLDTVDEDGTITASTAEGIFIFVPTVQNENEGEETISALPVEIKAEMRQGTSYSDSRLTSDTLWIPMPSDESLPQIELKSDENGTTQFSIK